ncbi:MAG TPA: alpha-galactosidase [Erysipelothrix sp.]|nr:alpha-galactosidase [Erysipelothrix sp.]
MQHMSNMLLIRVITMIDIRDHKIYFTGKESSYWMQVNVHRHLEQLYYGPRIPLQEVDVLENKNRVQFGSQVNIHEGYSLNTQLLEFSSAGKGDFRPVSIELESDDDSFVSDLRVSDVYINEKIDFPSEYFSPRINENTQQCVIELTDDYFPVLIKLFYTFYSEYDVIIRHTQLLNKSENEVIINKVMSTQLDLLESDYKVLSLNGSWGKEAQITIDDVNSGTLVHESLVGSSSALNNPGLLLFNDESAYGFNLMYSGNHYNSVTHHIDDSLRVMMGINPHQFKYHLQMDEVFNTPLALMTYSNQSRKGVTQNFHRFIRDMIIPEPPFEKPIVYNHWEGTFFDYDHKKLVSFATKAADLGMELFCIDDGWFGQRDDDFRSLGDYSINQKKFPQGIKHTIDKIKGLGLKVGIWVEPEMVSEDSDLYRTHPEWVVGRQDKPRIKGRNQWILDLCQVEVQDYIIQQVSHVIDNYGVDYIKWDMNRNHSDQYSNVLKHQKEFDIRYQQGLVRVLREIFYSRPHIFLEMCSSGGNRFDLGMLAVAQQIWTSDNTDAMDRLRIQEGTAIFYPLSAISNHVSGRVNTQTIRHNPLSTRFNVAIFGGFGYELDLNICSKVELDEIRKQIEVAKSLRELIVYGDYQVLKSKLENRVVWQVKYKDEALVGLFQTINYGLQSKEKLRVKDLDPEKFYRVTSIDQALFIDRFGELLKHVTNLKVHPYGAIMHKYAQHKSMDDGKFEAISSGALLSNGILLNEIYMGTGYHPELRIWGDFGSTLYHIREIDYEA